MPADAIIDYKDLMAFYTNRLSSDTLDKPPIPLTDYERKVYSKLIEWANNDPDYWAGDNYNR